MKANCSFDFLNGKILEFQVFLYIPDNHTRQDGRERGVSFWPEFLMGPKMEIN